MDNLASRGEAITVSKSGGISKTVFIAGIVLAVIVSVVISTVISSQLAVGPEGPKGEKGDTGDTGPAGETGDTGEQGYYQSYYDSGWINITDLKGEYLTLEHGLEGTDFIVDITGKATADSEYQQHLGLTGYLSGFAQTYGGTGEDYGSSVVATSDGGYAIVGSIYKGSNTYYTDSGHPIMGPDDYDVLLIKTDAFGNVEWNKTYGGTNSDGGILWCRQRMADTR